jgi:hypothetical protein
MDLEVVAVQRAFDKLRLNYCLEPLVDKHINLCFDGTYFGRGLCYLVYRANVQNIYYKRVHWETIGFGARSVKGTRIYF